MIRLLIFCLLFALSACKTEQASVSSGETATTTSPQENLDSAPVGMSVAAGLVLEDTQSGLITLPYTDADGDRATSCEISQRSYVTVATPCSCNSFGICRVRVKPILNYNGPASFTFSVMAKKLVSPPSLVSFTVFPVQDPPRAPDHSFSVLENTTYTSSTVSSLRPNLPATDPDGGTLTCSRVINPTRGTLTVNSDCSFTYVPLADDVGNYFFTYQVSDGTLTSGTGRVDITVVRNNLPPVATGAVVSTYQGVPVTFTLSATDPNGDALTYEVSVPPSGTIQVIGNQVTYTPVPSFIGAINLTFVAIDGMGLTSAAAGLQINVTPATYYLSTTGNDSTAALNDPSKPFLTTQALVNAAIAFEATAIKPLALEIGAGTFGHATISTNFGTNVTWSGVSHTASVIGNITARGANGANSTGVGDLLAGAWNGGDGLNGYSLTINSEFDTASSRYTLSFGSITVDGGNGGLHTPDPSFIPRPGLPGDAGSATLAGYFFSVSAVGGQGFAGGAGGQVTLKSDSTALSINASGGEDRCQLALSCATTVDGKRGGTVLIEERAVVSGSVLLSGSESKGLAATGRRTSGTGGTIRIFGTVNGVVSARGGNSYDSTVGKGGTVVVESSGIITNQIYAGTGITSNTGFGNLAGTVTVYGTALDIDVSSSFGGGHAGRVDVFGVARNIQAYHLNASCNSGAAGTIMIRSGGLARNIYAYGGSGACVPSTAARIDIYGSVTDTIQAFGWNTSSAGIAPGKGGTVSVHMSGSVNNVYAGGGDATTGTCLNGGDGGLITTYPGATFNLGSLNASGGGGDVLCGRSSGAMGTIINL